MLNFAKCETLLYTGNGERLHAGAQLVGTQIEQFQAVESQEAAALPCRQAAARVHI